MDCKYEEYDSDGKHCKLSFCAQGVGMRCKRDYSYESCEFYSPINGKNEKDLDCFTEVKDNAVRITAHEGSYVEMLNKEINQLIKSLPLNILKSMITKLAHEAYVKRDESKSRYAISSLIYDNSKDVDFYNNEYFKYMGQFEAYSKILELFDNIIDKD